MRRWGCCGALRAWVPGCMVGGAVCWLGYRWLRWAMGCLRGCHAMRGGHAREVPGALRDVAACPLGRVGASVLAMALCLVAG